MYVNDCIAGIKDRAGVDHYYIFGLDGVMKKGLTEYMGRTYYLLEKGAYEGSMYIGEITLNDKKYVFNDGGVVSVSAMTGTEQ